ncbi:MAG: DNA repair protein RecO [Bacteroidota bacterium]
MITKTDALVLKSMRYRDTSKIVTFYTRRYGKIKAIAKGARDLKSKFGAALEPMTLGSLLLYKKEHRELQLVSQCDIVRPYKNIHTEMDRMAVGLSILELVNLVTHDEEENPSLFSLLVDTFESLEKAERNFEVFFYAFELRLAALFGFSLSFQQCIICSKPLEYGEDAFALLFDIGKGGLYCPECVTRLGSAVLRSRSKTRLTAQTATIIERLLHDSFESIVTIDCRPSIGNELDETIRLYLQYHFEELKPLKTRAVFQKLNA